MNTLISAAMVDLVDNANREDESEQYTLSEVREIVYFNLRMPPAHVDERLAHTCLQAPLIPLRVPFLVELWVRRVTSEPFDDASVAAFLLNHGRVDAAFTAVWSRRVDVRTVPRISKFLRLVRDVVSSVFFEQIFFTDFNNKNDSLMLKLDGKCYLICFLHSIRFIHHQCCCGNFADQLEVSKSISSCFCFCFCFFAKLIISKLAYSVLFVFCLKNVDVGRVFLGKID